MAVNLKLLSCMVCDKLDTNAHAFWNDAEMKQFHPKFKELHSLLQKGWSCRFDQSVVLNSLLHDLKCLISDVDDLVDAWVQSEISRSKFSHKLRRIDGQLVPHLNSLRKVVAGGRDEDISSTSQELTAVGVAMGWITDLRQQNYLYAEGESAMDEDAAPGPEILTEAEMTCPPLVDTLAMHESKDQLTSIERGGRLAANVVRTTITSSNVPISEMEFEDESFQNKQKVRRIL